MAQPINSWGDFLRVLRDLKKPEAKDSFETIIVDTADIAFDLCEKYVCSQEGVDSIADIPFGKGYGMVAKEFDEKLRSIAQMDYGLVTISHAVDKVFTDESGQEFNQIVPTLPKNAQKIVSRMCDIIGYSRAVETEAGLETRLFMRGTPRFVAGSRFSDVPEVGYQFPRSIKFGYTELVGTIGDAVDALEKQFGASAVTDEDGSHNKVEKEVLEVEDIILNFNEVASTLMTKNPEYYGPRIQQVVETHFGKGKKISEATLAQADLAYLVLQEVSDFLED